MANRTRWVITLNVLNLVVATGLMLSSVRPGWYSLYLPYLIFGALAVFIWHFRLLESIRGMIVMVALAALAVLLVLMLSPFFGDIRDIPYAQEVRMARNRAVQHHFEASLARDEVKFWSQQALKYEGDGHEAVLTYCRARAAANAESARYHSLLEEKYEAAVRSPWLPVPPDPPAPPRPNGLDAGKLSRPFEL